MEGETTKPLPILISDKASTIHTGLRMPLDASQVTSTKVSPNLLREESIELQCNAWACYL